MGESGDESGPKKKKRKLTKAKRKLDMRNAAKQRIESSADDDDDVFDDNCNKDAERDHSKSLAAAESIVPADSVASETHYRNINPKGISHSKADSSQLPPTVDKERMGRLRKKRKKVVEEEEDRMRRKHFKRVVEEEEEEEEGEEEEGEEEEEEEEEVGKKQKRKTKRNESPVGKVLKRRHQSAGEDVSTSFGTDASSGTL